jgi:hypothetical protein
MNRFLLVASLALLSAGMVGCTPPPPTGPGGIRVNNVNGDIPNERIRLWILTEEEIQNPPQTKLDAELLQSYVIPRFRTFTFNRPAGTYFVVASNETHFQSLAQLEPFEANVDFSLLEVEVADTLIPVEVFNTNRPNRLPQIRRR